MYPVNPQMSRKFETTSLRQRPPSQPNPLALLYRRFRRLHRRRARHRAVIYRFCLIFHHSRRMARQNLARRRLNEDTRQLAQNFLLFRFPPSPRPHLLAAANFLATVRIIVLLATCIRVADFVIATNLPRILNLL